MTTLNITHNEILFISVCVARAVATACGDSHGILNLHVHQLLTQLGPERIEALSQKLIVAHDALCSSCETEEVAGFLTRPTDPRMN
jgi:hypothetical protein